MMGAYASNESVTDVQASVKVEIVEVSLCKRFMHPLLGKPLCRPRASSLEPIRQSQLLVWG